MLRELIEKVLRQAGYKVLMADSATAALNVLENEEGIALVLTDLIMPGMTGEALALEIERRYPKVGVVLMSGNAIDARSTLLSLQPGVNFLSKPFTISALLKIVELRQSTSNPP